MAPAQPNTVAFLEAALYISLTSPPPRFWNCSMVMDPIQLIGGFKGEIIGSAQKLGLIVYGRLKTSWKFQNQYYFVDPQIGLNFTVSTPWQLPLKLSFPRHYELSMSGQNRMTPSSFAELRKSLALLGRDGEGLCVQCVSKSATICQPPLFRSCLCDFWWGSGSVLNSCGNSYENSVRNRENPWIGLASVD